MGNAYASLLSMFVHGFHEKLNVMASLKTVKSENITQNYLLCIKMNLNEILVQEGKKLGANPGGWHGVPHLSWGFAQFHRSSSKVSRGEE